MAYRGTVMTRPEAADWRKGEDCKGYGHCICHVHPITRSCGHVDRLHFSDLCRFWKDRARFRATACGECAGMQEEGFPPILDNFPQFAAGGPLDGR